MDGSFAKGLRVLETLAAADKPMGLTELADRCGLVKSHAHKFLKTLIDQRYAQQTRGRGPYQLTLKVWELGARTLPHADLVSAARDPMQEISAHTCETSSLAVLDQRDAVYIYKIDGTQEILTHTYVGRRRPAYCVAAGKAILAFQMAAVVDDIAAHIQHHTRRTVSDAAGLRAELDRVRRQGYAVNWGEWADSVRGVAAPIRNASGMVIAALNVSLPAERLDEKVVERLAPAVMDCALRISRSLGHIPLA
jgi:IclR family KDG regulon transcriptional repressor